MYTHFANLLFAGMFASIGSAHLGFGTNQVHFGQALGWFAVPHAVCETAISSHADAAGLGQGKLQGDIGNFVALVKIFVPMVYGADRPPPPQLCAIFPTKIVRSFAKTGSVKYKAKAWEIKGLFSAGRAMAWGAANGIPGAAIYTASAWWLVSSLLFCLVRESDIRAMRTDGPVK
jgi:hypothetical protein